MLFHNRSYRTQVFFFTLLLALLPVFACTLIISANLTKEFSQKYQDTFDHIAAQTNLSIDQALSNSIRISTLPLINSDVNRALNTDYGASSPSSKYASDLIMIKQQIMQANLLNTDIDSAIFINRYGYTFEYGNTVFTNYLSNIKELAQNARDIGVRTWVGPLQKSGFSNSSYQNILPIVRLMWDVTTNQELGVMGVAVNFDTVDNILKTSTMTDSHILLLDRNNKLYYSHDEKLFADGKNQALLEALQAACTDISTENPDRFTSVWADHSEYMVSISYNKTADWKIVHFVDKSLLYYASIYNLSWLFPMFLLLVLSSFFLSALVTRKLSKNASQLVEQIDRFESSTGCTLKPIKNASYEFTRIVESYNRLTQRLVRSTQDMYVSQLNEKQARLQMLQAQINPHFLYNTLNLMASLANIYDAPEIRIVAIKMADILRYNLKSGPIVTLKEEIDQVERYIAIQAIRFPDKYVMECALPAELQQMQVPSFILQPIVENAVLHGLSECERDGYVMINCFVEFDKLHILIADNGVGICPEKLAEIRQSLEKATQEPHSSIGLCNVNQRIQAYCGSDCSLSISSTEGKGTIVEITLLLSEEITPPLPKKS